MEIFYSRIAIVVPLMLPQKSDLYDGSLIKVQPGACWYIYHPMCHLHDAPGPHAYFHFIHLCNDRANQFTKKSSKITVIRKKSPFLIRETDLHQNFCDPRIIEKFRKRSAIYVEFKLKVSEEKKTCLHNWETIVWLLCHSTYLLACFYSQKMWA